MELNAQPHELTAVARGGKSPRNRLNVRLDGTQSRSGRLGKEINLVTLPGFEPQIVRRLV